MWTGTTVLQHLLPLSPETDVLPGARGAAHATAASHGGLVCYFTSACSAPSSAHLSTQSHSHQTVCHPQTLTSVATAGHPSRVLILLVHFTRGTLLNLRRPARYCLFIGPSFPPQAVWGSLPLFLCHLHVVTPCFGQWLAQPLGFVFL